MSGAGWGARGGPDANSILRALCDLWQLASGLFSPGKLGGGLGLLRGINWLRYPKRTVGALNTW